ncbi:glutathione S-transferase family protein [Phenylobacterium aquaticum]|uniref:glutathione S-transferase family protein n=1 Tax=Phenylobacterium aquaticum TaxID=1763816 RepID=UPI0026EA4497|nr:glutathione S-transferase family protein [Phenylobacterium aquaticum]
MPLTLYDTVHSVYARRVRLLAAELDIPITRVSLDYGKGDMKTPAYLAKNPGARVPALEDGDFVVWESLAILNYLASLRPERGMSPDNAKARAVIDQWAAFWLCQPAAAIGALAQEKIVKPMRGQPSHNETIVAGAEAMLARDLPVIEGQLAGRDYLLGDLGVIDFLMAPQMEALPRLDIDLAAYPNIAAWLTRISAKPYWATA